MRFGTWRRQELTPFFVWKEGRKNENDFGLSTIEFVVRPRHVHFVSGEGLANLEAETDEIGDGAGLWRG